MNASSPRLVAREALAEFIRDASKAFDEAYWFVLRGECDFSLCTQTLLLLEEYAELLHHTELLVLGKKGYVYSEVTWRDFLREYGLFGHGDLGIAEVTPYRAFVHKLMTPGSTSDMKTRKDLLFLRIGRYDEYGLTTNPPDQFKHNVRLPTFTPKLRTAAAERLSWPSNLSSVQSTVKNWMIL